MIKETCSGSVPVMVLLLSGFITSLLGLYAGSQLSVLNGIP